MSKFKITSITCLNQQEQEKTGTDEIYFKLFDAGNNSPYKSNLMHGLDQDPNAPYHTVHPGEVYDFEGKLRVELWEYDKGSNPDEKLQSFTVDAHNIEHGFWESSSAVYNVQHDVL
jgi:hypothetical protein